MRSISRRDSGPRSLCRPARSRSDGEIRLHVAKLNCRSVRKSRAVAKARDRYAAARRPRRPAYKGLSSDLMLGRHSLVKRTTRIGHRFVDLGGLRSECLFAMLPCNQLSMSTEFVDLGKTYGEKPDPTLKN
jgi:hypothetical protein